MCLASKGNVKTTHSHARTHRRTRTNAHTPSSVGGIEVVVGSEQVPRDDLRVPDVEVTSVGSDILVGAAIARLPWFRNEAPVTIYIRVYKRSANMRPLQEL